MKSSSTKVLLALLLLGFLGRAWGAFSDPTQTWDETDHVQAALSLNAYGTTANMTWMHPPLSLLMLGRSLALLGDDPWGWRANGVVFGTATIALLFLVGRSLFPGSSIPIVAAALLAFDPFHAFFSRSTMMEIPVTAFFLLYLYLMLEFAERGRATLPLAGLALGLTISTKAYFALAIPIVVAYAALRARQRGEAARRLLGDLALSQLVLPLAVMLFAYGRWFGRGYTALEFVQMRADALRTLREVTIERFDAQAQLVLRGAPWEWFTRPTMIGSVSPLPGGETARFRLEIENPPFRVLVLPAMAVVCARAWTERSLRLLLVPALFAAVYAPALLLGRPVFSYSVLPALPFAYLAIAHALSVLAARTRHATGITAAFLAAVVLWGAYTLPLISARPLPTWPYRPLLELTTIVGGG